MLSVATGIPVFGTQYDGPLTIEFLQGHAEEIDIDQFLHGSVLPKGLVVFCVGLVINTLWDLPNVADPVEKNRCAGPHHGKRDPAWLQSKQRFKHLIINMDRMLLAAALRVLTCSYNGLTAAAEDVDLLRAHADRDEQDFEIDQLARRVACRLLRAKT